MSSPLASHALRTKADACPLAGNPAQSSRTPEAERPSTPETIAILGIGVALAGPIRQGQRGLGARMDRLDVRMDRLESRMDVFETGLREIRDRLSRLEGKMDFPEGCIVRRNDPEPAAAG